MLQKQYYILERANNDSQPMFAWNQKSSLFRKNAAQPVTVETPVKLKLSEPIPSNPEYVDYHTSPDPIISSKLSDALRSADIYGVQLIPAEVTDPRQPFPEPRDYSLMHVWNRISCLNMDESEVELFDDGDIFSIDTLVLREDVLNAFEEHKRQIFYLSEKPSVLIVHEGVKNLMESCQPLGCRFFKADEWNSDSSFEP